MYDVREIHNADEWEQFVLAQPTTLFVQSPSYGKFYEAMGERYWIFGIYENETLVGGSLVLSVHARRGDFLYLPYGPILDYGDSAMMREFAGHLSQFAKKNHFDFIRISPFVDDTAESRGVVQLASFRPAPMHMLAETTWMLDLTPPEDTLLAAMGKNHRNLIRRCIKEGVRVEVKRDNASLTEFNSMHDATSKRHEFHRFSKEYIGKEFQVFSKNNTALIFHAYLPDGRLDSAAIVMYYGTMAAYRHAASLGQDKRLPTSYLLQWEAIREAKRRGMKWYNFWGIAPADASKHHPFAGITHFKRGFGGFQKDLLHCHDLPLSWKYWVNWMIESARRKKRRF
ncbi:MAG: hypothetical protein A3C90_02550 [Candidatus Magasanikbacteria bacterium RIFCSPHIGHO2_02_FULL_51_14]|uniref:BioF2-like acetyltransferase domain-containing protein n=1 Tax=Candidatus Magasanikbacteria bacterium RIFCSPHIGHO2_02_FULL_51_14 TaxID=1798683 RepID=A0A1F6MD82_9BACT|nr:MAG: hypothetical protein A3C90_02550 [Candidatus Magasanikbacteria bacterium RIFCSPHIGHO2_02_FULL_51_14]